VNPNPALIELTDLWYRLPGLVGDAWPELRPRLLAAIEALATAPPEEYQGRARELLRLLLGHEEVKKRLAPALIGRTIPTDRAPHEQDTGTLPGLELARRAGILLPGDDRPDDSGRWISAEAEEGDPARPGTWVLSLGLTDTHHGTAAAEPLSDLGEPDSWPVTLTVRVAGQDAEVEHLSDTLTVPRHGPSPDRARFRVTPSRPGTLQLFACFFRGNNLVQWMLLNATADGVRGRSQGTSWASVAEVRGRGLSVHVRPTGNFYEIELSGDIGQGCRGQLRKTDAQLAVIAEAARAPLRALVDAHGPLADTDRLTGLELPQAVYDTYAGQLAESGCLMFRNLFVNGANTELEEVGRVLQEYLAKSPRSVQFVTERPLLPWHLMCPVQAVRDATFDRILGLRHEVDCLPLVPNARNTVTEVAIDTRPGLNVTLAVNRDIDRGGERSLVADQIAYWRGFLGRGLTDVTVHDERQAVLKVLCGQDAPAEIVYLYCHAAASDPDDGGPEYAKLVLTRDASVLLRSLHLHGGALPGAPLIVLNACSTATTSPLDVGGFLTHFLALSRGVLGTEADTPAPFAAAWATRFFDRLLAGERMGAAVRATRQDFVTRYRNPLGLLYGLYCNGDTVLRPGIAPRARQDQGPE
jgi:hypothetical protein